MGRPTVSPKGVTDLLSFPEPINIDIFMHREVLSSRDVFKDK